MRKLLIIFFIASALSACYRMRISDGGGEIGAVPPRSASPADILLAPGYGIELVAEGLTFPTASAFDDQGNLYVIEAGYCYGEVWGEPKLIRVQSDGSKIEIAKGPRNGPWTGLAFHDGNFYISEGGAAEGGKILRVSPRGEMKVLTDGLPSVGDHHTNNLVIKEGYIYFGQGSATNSAVVGPDNADFGWLKRKEDFHDIPCRDIVLTGENYESLNVLTEDPDDKTSTGAFSPFGTPTSPGQVIRGRVPCTGSILRVPVDGGEVEMVSWGLRNPYGIGLSQEGKLYITENAFDDRGSRPVWGAGDVMWELQPGMWYGWPDYSEGMPLRNDEEFKPPTEGEVKPLMKQLPNELPAPVAVFGVHASANGFDFSVSDTFGYRGEAFVALFGDMAPGVGKVLKPVGFKIVRVDIDTGVIRDFAVNKGKRTGPASWLGSGGLERPVSVSFDPSGENLYVVDFGILKMTADGPQPQENTGVIWKISKN